MTDSHRSRADLISGLAESLQPVSDPGKISSRTILWLGGSTLACLAFMLVVGPFRPGFVEQLMSVPRFAIESTIGVVAIIALAIVAFRSAIPDVGPLARVSLLPLGLVAIWVGFYLFGLHDPALAPSMLGKREHCFVEVLLYGVPTLVAGLVALRRLYPLHGAYSGAMLGLAAGAIPALLMQFACMYIVPHMLSFHLLPVLAIAALGSVSGYFFVKTD